MDFHSLILSFFLTKKLTLLTAFLCWSNEEIENFCRNADRFGVRLRVYGNFGKIPQLPPYDVRREGMVVDVTCPNASMIFDEASLTRAFNLRHAWLLLQNTPFNITHLHSTLRQANILPDADVTWASSDILADVYRVKENEPLIVTNLGLHVNVTVQELEVFWKRFPTAVKRRKDLGNVFLNAAIVLTQPQHFKGWDDLSDKQIDTYSKVTHPIMKLVAEDLNLRYNARQVDLYGQETNGSFDGVVGYLQRGEVEIGIASIFMRADRWRVLHFCSETVALRGAFIFQQPTQASVTNVFLLPFSRGVWCAIVGVVLLSALLLGLLARELKWIDSGLATLTASEVATFAVGSVCQQGTHVSPSLASVRVIMFFTLTTSLFAFTAYSAKIVAILQSPSDAIQTIDDLTNSHMGCGVQETTYKKTYFAESTDAATQRLYRKKLLPLGEAAYLSVVEGIARMRTGRFAFQTEESAGYEIISKTFTEREKCGLQQIQAFKLPMVCVPVRKHSGYKDLLAVRLRWQRETGLMGRIRRIWISSKPRCDSGTGGFVSVGLVDVLPCVQILAIGMSVAIFLLIVECAVYTLNKRNPRFLTQKNGKEYLLNI